MLRSRALSAEGGESRRVALKRDVSRPDLFGMPYLLAAVAAWAAGLLSDTAVSPVAGAAGSMVLSLVVSSVVFVFAKRFFADLRGGR